MTLLDQRFFERVATTNHKGGLLESYKAVYARSTMVLFSRKTRTPLAALTLKADDVGCLSMLTGRPTPRHASEPYFQGMLNMPNQAFTFTISNLSDQGMINFNILHTPHRVSEVNPGPAYGINEVNELHTNQSYTIPADQRSSCKMVLTGKTKTIKDPETLKMKEVAVTVKDSEATDKPTGLYFYLNVVPDNNCKPLVDKFSEGTIWKVTPGFVRRVPKPSISSNFYGSNRGGLYDIESGGMRRGGRGRSGLSTSDINASVLEQQNNERINELSDHVAHLKGRTIDIGNEVREQNSLFDGMGTFDSGDFDDNTRSTLGASVPATVGPGFRSAASLVAFEGFSTFKEREQAEREQAVGAAQGPGIGSMCSVRSPIRSGPSLATSQPFQGSGQAEKISPSGDVARGVALVDVGTTQAAELVYGQQVEVHSSYTGHDYAYEHCSEPTVLCMSIWQDMKFKGLSNTIEQDLEAEVKEWVENEGRALIDSLNAIFKTDTCVIDLESKADTIVCTCGHQCINHQNVSNKIDKCPMCRSPITAFVRADGIMLS